MYRSNSDSPSLSLLAAVRHNQFMSSTCSCTPTSQDGGRVLHRVARLVHASVGRRRRAAGEGRKRVMVLMSDTGGGHRASAEALKAGFQKLYGDKYEARPAARQLTPLGGNDGAACSLRAV